MSRISLKNNRLSALEIEIQRQNNSVSLFFSKTISLTRQRKKVRTITIIKARERDIEIKSIKKFVKSNSICFDNSDWFERVEL